MHTPLGIFTPTDRLELQKIVQEAYQKKIHLYPISSGKNWGNGSSSPWAPNCWILDLSRLNQITDFNENLAYITVEPGVTQEMLLKFLEQQNSSLMPCLTGASRHASLIGNALERGDGFGAYGEKARFVPCLEVILPNGQWIQVGNPLSTAQAGPSLEGLFFQSNLGIVTKMTFWLEPRPLYFHQVIFKTQDTKSLNKIIARFQRLQLQQIIAYTSIWNSEKFHSRVGKYLPNTPAWMGSGSLFAHSLEQAQAQIQLCHPFEVIQSEFNFQEHENLALAYWGKKIPLPKDPDPDRDGCGILWITCLLPYQGKDVLQALEIVAKNFSKHAFEPNTALVATEARSLKLIVAILYDRDSPGKEAEAQTCHDHTLRDLMCVNYLPYRLGIQSQWASSNNLLYQQIKNCLDPEHILSPGHYSPLPIRFSSRSSSSL